MGTIERKRKDKDKTAQTSRKLLPTTKENNKTAQPSPIIPEVGYAQKTGGQVANADVISIAGKLNIDKKPLFYGPSAHVNVLL